MNPYKVLGVERDATVDEIKKAYRKLAQKHHPDRGGDEAKFKQVAKAYDQIKDPEKAFEDRDRQQAHRNSAHFDDEGFYYKDQVDIEELLRKAHAARQQQQRQIKFSVPIELKDAVTGGKHFLRVPIGEKLETIEIIIPAGVEQGTSIKYPRLALGNDVVITFEIIPNKIWTVKNLDLIKNVKVSIWDLIKGAEVSVETIYSNTIKLKIPAGTQPEAMMRIKGKGIQSRKDVAVVGDMYVHIHAVIPDDIHQDILSAIYRTNS